MLETIKTNNNSSYNKEEPTNGVLIKDIPQAIRDKGESIIDYVGELEEARTSSSVSEAIKAFPYLQSVFVDGSSSIPSGMYIKQLNTWIGYENYDRMPSNIDLLELNQRVTIDNKTFEVINDNNIRIMSESNSFLPQVLFDFFELNTVATLESLQNRGLYSASNIVLEVRNAKRYANTGYPYLVTTPSSKITTQNLNSSKFPLENRTTTSCTFVKVSRKYQDGSGTVMNPSDLGGLIRIHDESDTFNIAMYYNDQMDLYSDINGIKTLLNYKLDESNYYQLSIKLLNGKAHFIVNSKEVGIQDVSKIILPNHTAYVSFGGFYSQSAICVGTVPAAAVMCDPLITREAITLEENVCLKDSPRSYSLSVNKESYITLSIEEQRFLKDFVSKQNLTV